MIIATHNGSFHADEVTACVIFTLLDPNVSFIRSRDPEVLEKADYVIDVSGQFDLKKHFDHHPRDFNLARKNGIKYATAGLIWNKFGIELLKKTAQAHEALKGISEDTIKKAWKSIDKGVMEFIDLSDNGQLDEWTAKLADVSVDSPNEAYNNLKRFYANVPNIPFLVARQNVFLGTEEEQLNNFKDTVTALTILFKNLIVNELILARDEDKVLAAYDGSEILWLDVKLPWFDAVQNNWDKFTNCKIAIYPDSHGKGYRIQSLPGSQFLRFENRCNAPIAWRGKENEELAKISGIPTITFVHKTGFTGGAGTKEDILLMARKWIDGSDK